MPRLTESAEGVYVIAPTPFDDGGAIDEGSIDNMVNFFLSAGADGLTIMGMMGEAEKLTQDESVAVMKRVMAAVADRVPVIVGVSSPGLASLVGLSRTAMDLGAAGVMVAPTPNLRTDAQIKGYFATVAEALGPDTSFVLQDFPLATGVRIDASVIIDIIRDHPNCVMLKHEDWPGLAKITALRKASDEGSRRISILCGNSGLFLPEEMARGADGAMTGFAFPEMMIGVCRHAKAGDHDKAKNLFEAYLPMIRYESQPGLGLALRKHVLAHRGIIANAALRRPGPKLAPQDIAEIDTLLDRQAKRIAALNEEN